MAKEIIPLASLFAEASKEIKKSAEMPNVYSYVPYPKQRTFHSTDAFGRLFLGGNRAGKTDANVVECIWWLTGTHPYLKTPDGPIQGRMIVVDITKGIWQIALPKFKRWIPKDQLIHGRWDHSWSEANKTLTLANGSTIDFLTYEMDMDKHGGVPRHFISFDEEPPQHIFNEAMMRLIDYDGQWWASLTPLQGLTWMHEDIYLPAKEDQKLEPEDQKFPIKVFETSIFENPHLKGLDDIDKFSIAMSKEEKETRQYGKFIAKSGRIFPEFDDASHVIPFQLPPKTWEWYMSMDEGWNNPTAVLWHAVSPNGTIVTFSEHYERELTLQQHADIIKTRETMWGRTPDLRTGDPAMKQTSTQTGVSKLQMLSEFGIDLSVDRVPRDVETGIFKMQQYLRVSPATGKSVRWFVMDNCVNFIREMKGLRWASYSSRKTQFELNVQEKVHKKNDHTFDAARYFATFMPDLRPDDDSLPELPGGRNFDSYDTMMTRIVNDPDTERGWVTQESDYDYFEG